MGLYFRTALTGKVMWKKVCCAGVVSVSRQVEELRSVKATFLRGPGMDQQEKEGTLQWTGREVTWREGKEGHVQWEQFPDLLTALEVMLFIFGRLLMSGELQLSSGLPGTWHALQVSSLGEKKTCEMSLDWCCSLTQLYFTIPLVGLSAYHSLFLNLSLSLSFTPSLCLLSLSILSFFWSSFSPYLPLHRPPITSITSLVPGISRLSRGSQVVVVVPLDLAGLFFTDALRPVDKCFSLIYWLLE